MGPSLGTQQAAGHQNVREISGFEIVICLEEKKKNEKTQKTEKRRKTAISSSSSFFL
jgi:hypothetical protein